MSVCRNVLLRMLTKRRISIHITAKFQFKNLKYFLAVKNNLYLGQQRVVQDTLIFIKLNLSIISNLTPIRHFQVLI